MKNYNYIILLFVLLFSFNINAQQDDQEVTAASRKAEKLSEASNSSTIITEKEVSNKKSYNVLGLLDITVGVNVVRLGVNQFYVSLREGVDVFSTQTILLSDGRELNTYGLNFFDASASTLSGLDTTAASMAAMGTLHSVRREIRGCAGFTVCQTVGGQEQSMVSGDGRRNET